MDVVLDRVDMSDRQILNLARYLRGDFAEYGLFGFPHPTHVTHADSRYVEGLQVVDHLARLAYAVSAGTATEQQTDLLRDFMRMHSVISSRQFAMRDEAEDGLSRFARETQ